MITIEREREIVEAAIQSGLAERRAVLVGVFDDGVRSRIPAQSNGPPLDQLMHDIRTLAKLRDPIDGVPLLALWLEQAASLLGPHTPHSADFSKWADELRRASQPRSTEGLGKALGGEPPSPVRRKHQFAMLAALLFTGLAIWWLWSDLSSEPRRGSRLVSAVTVSPRAADDPDPSRLDCVPGTAPFRVDSRPFTLAEAARRAPAGAISTVGPQWNSAETESHLALVEDTEQGQAICRAVGGRLLTPGEWDCAWRMAADGAGEPAFASLMDVDQALRSRALAEWVEGPNGPAVRIELFGVRDSARPGRTRRAAAVRCAYDLE